MISRFNGGGFCGGGAGAAFFLAFFLHSGFSVSLFFPDFRPSQIGMSALRLTGFAEFFAVLAGGHAFDFAK